MSSRAAGEEGWSGETSQFADASSRGTRTARVAVPGPGKRTF